MPPTAAAAPSPSVKTPTKWPRPTRPSRIIGGRKLAMTLDNITFEKLYNAVMDGQTFDAFAAAAIKADLAVTKRVIRQDNPTAFADDNASYRSLVFIEGLLSSTYQRMK